MEQFKSRIDYEPFESKIMESAKHFYV